MRGPADVAKRLQAARSTAQSDQPVAAVGRGADHCLVAFENAKGLSNIDLSQIDGNQYFTVPGPSSLAMLGLGGLMASRRRRA